MSNTCKNICINYKFPTNGGNSRMYLNGAKRCQNCHDGIYLLWAGIFCPCCGIRLRLRPRKSKLKQVVLEENKIKAYW